MYAYKPRAVCVCPRCRRGYVLKATPDFSPKNSLRGEVTVILPPPPGGASTSQRPLRKATSPAKKFTLVSAAWCTALSFACNEKNLGLSHRNPSFRYNSANFARTCSYAHRSDSCREGPRESRRKARKSARPQKTREGIPSMYGGRQKRRM